MTAQEVLGRVVWLLALAVLAIALAVGVGGGRLPLPCVGRAAEPLTWHVR
jgi:hypothetical protein